FRIDGDLIEIPASAPDAVVFGNLLPVLPAIIRAVQSALLGIRDQVNPLCIAGSKRDAHPSQSFRGQSLSFDGLPVFSAVVRTVQPAARPIRRRVDAPRWSTRLRSEEHTSELQSPYDL